MKETWDQPSKNPIFVFLLCSHDGHQNLMAILTHFLWNGIGQKPYVFVFIVVLPRHELLHKLFPCDRSTFSSHCILGDVHCIAFWVTISPPQKF